MKSCVICFEQLPPNEEHALLFVDDNENEKEVCEQCFERFEKLNDNDEGQKIKEYFNGRIKLLSDESVINFLSELLENRSELKLSHEQSVRSTDSQKMWVSILRAVAWVEFGVIIVAGIVLAVILADVNPLLAFLSIVLSVPLALVVTAGTMIILDLVDNVRVIRQITEQNNGG